MTSTKTPLSHHPALALVSLQADLNTNMEDEGGSFYGVSSQYESPENMVITCSTKVCSFGKQVVEKVEVRLEGWRSGWVGTQPPATREGAD